MSNEWWRKVDPVIKSCLKKNNPVSPRISQSLKPFYHFTRNHIHAGKVVGYLSKHNEKEPILLLPILLVVLLQGWKWYNIAYWGRLKCVNEPVEKTKTSRGRNILCWQLLRSRYLNKSIMPSQGNINKTITQKIPLWRCLLSPFFSVGVSQTKAHVLLLPIHCLSIAFQSWNIPTSELKLSKSPIVKKSNC